MQGPNPGPPPRHQDHLGRRVRPPRGLEEIRSAGVQWLSRGRRVKATVKVTPDRERTPLVMLEGNVRHVAQKRLRKIAHEEITI
jgi:hypothetical protein